MTLLLPWMPPDGVEALIVWLGEIGETRASRPPGGVYPFHMITELPGDDDKITHHGKYRVHSFDIAHDGNTALRNAYLASRLAWQRILAFAPPLVGQQWVTLSDGKTVAPDQVKTKMSPHWEKYSEDGTVERFITEFDIDWRFIAV